MINFEWISIINLETILNKQSDVFLTSFKSCQQLSIGQPFHEFDKFLFKVCESLFPLVILLFLYLL